MYNTILEKLIYNKVILFIITDAQHGFRHNKST